RNLRTHPLPINENGKSRTFMLFAPLLPLPAFQPDVDGDDFAAAIPSEQRSAFDSAEADREIGDDAQGVVTASRVEAARDIESYDCRSAGTQVIDGGNPVADFAAWRVLE